MFPNSAQGAIGFGWNVPPSTNPIYPSPVNMNNQWGNGQTQQIGFCLNPPTTFPQNPPSSGPFPHMYPQSSVGFGFGPLNAPPVPNMTSPSPVSVEPAYPQPSAPPMEKETVTNISRPPRPNAPPIKMSESISDSNKTSKSISDQSSSILVEVRPRSPRIDLRNKDDDPQEERRRGTSYQEGLRDMAALMTDVDLKDDDLRNLQNRFNLKN